MSETGALCLGWSLELKSWFDTGSLEVCGRSHGVADRCFRMGIVPGGQTKCAMRNMRVLKNKLAQISLGIEILEV